MKKKVCKNERMMKSSEGLNKEKTTKGRKNNNRIISENRRNGWN